MLHDLRKSHFYDLKLIFLNFPPVPLCSPESRVRFFRSAEAPASVAYIKAGFACSPLIRHNARHHSFYYMISSKTDADSNILVYTIYFTLSVKQYRETVKQYQE